MEETKRNDFFATLINNPDLTIKDLKDNDITPDNSSLLSKDEYKNMEAVKNCSEFLDDNGKFDDNKFDEYYKSAQILYNNYDQVELLQKLSKEQLYDPHMWYAPDTAKYKEVNPVVQVNDTTTNDAYGISFLPETTRNQNNFSIREIAQTQKVYNTETGEWEDWTPNDKAGLFKRLTIPTLVLAQWDEDGEHEENGISVQHKAGDLKLNDEYKPYYETLGNRDVYGKDVLHNSDILTVDGSKWNKFDFFDSDDVEKDAVKTTFNLVAKVAPLFIPGVGEIYGYLGAVDALAKVLPTFTKAINNITFANEDVNKAMSVAEGYMGRFESTQSDYGRSHFVSYENLTNLIIDTAGQLFEQRAISTIPAIFKKSKTFEDVNNISEFGKKLALGYMALTSAQDSYSTAKENGASDKAASVIMLANVAALYKLMNIDYFRDNLFKDTYMDESQVRGAIKGAAKTVSDKFANMTKAGTQKEAAGLFKKAQNFYYDTLLKGMQQKGFAGLIARGTSEATEEVMEEITSDLIKATSQGLNALGFVNMSEEGKNLEFDWSAKEIAQRYGATFAGGFIGGLVFAGQDRYKQWLTNKQFDIPKVTPSDKERLVYYLATGKRDEINYYLDRWYKKGLLGSTNLGIDGQIVKGGNGEFEYVADSKGVSQNEAVYNTLKHELDVLEQSIKAEGGLKYLTAEGLDKLRVLGYNEANIAEHPELLAASTIVALGDYNSFENDFFKNLSDIVDVKNKSDARIKELSGAASTDGQKKSESESIKNDQTVKDLQEQLKKLREDRELFYNGEKNKYYSGQALFSADKNLHSKFINLDIDTFSKLKYGKSLESFSKEKQKEINNDFEDYNKNEGRTKIYKAYDLYLELSAKFQPIIDKFGANLQKQLDKKFETDKLLGITNFLEAKEKFDSLELEKSEINKNNELNTEQSERLKKINEEQNTLAKQFAIIMQNPNLANITPSNDSIVDAYTGVANSENKIELYDDLTSEFETIKKHEKKSSIPTNNVLEVLRDIYKHHVTSGEFKFNDDDLFALYNGIASSYKRTGGAKSRLEHYLLKLEEDSYWDKYEHPDFVPNVELDPDNIIWARQDLPDDVQTEIENHINNIVSNLTDSVLVDSEYKELLKSISKVSKLTDPINEKYLKGFLDIVLPTINGKSIIDIVHEFDEYREKINYSPFLSIAAQIGVDVKDLNLLQLVNKESQRLSNSDRVDSYIMSDANRKALDNENLKKSLDIVTALCIGAADGTNATMNNFNGGTIPKLGVINPDAAKFLLRQGDILLNRINFLRTISDGNKANSLREHKQTAITMSPKFIKAILDLNDEFEKEFSINLKNIWNDYSLNINDENYAEFEDKVIGFKQTLYDRLHGKYSNTDLAKKLINLVNKSELWKLRSSKISSNKENEITPFDIVDFFATTLTLPDSKFYSVYKSLDFKNKTIAPIFGQEYVIKQAIAEYINPDLFNCILDEISNNADYSTITSDKVKKYYENRPKLYNLITVLGSAGSGKTIGVLKTFIEALTGANFDIHFIARTNIQAEKARNSSELGSAKFSTIDEYIKTVYGNEFRNYKNKDDLHTVSSDFGKETGKSVFDLSKKSHILVIDEIETLSESELKGITLNAKNNNIIVVGLGDLKQPGLNVVVGNDKKSTGIEDCLYRKSPTLTTSMRSLTLAKVENTTLMSSALDKVIEEAQKDPNINIDQRANLVNEYLKNATLYYYESEDGSLSGDMSVKTKEELVSKIQKLTSVLKGEETLGIITDKPGDYKKFEVPGKVQVIDYKDRAGGEWDYVVVDADLKANNSRNGSINSYLLTQDLYTLTQRSKYGTVIKLDDNVNLFKFKSDENKKQIVSFDKNIPDFFKWRFDALKNIKEDPTALLSVLDSKTVIQSVPKSSTLLQTVLQKSTTQSEYKPETKPEVKQDQPTSVFEDPEIKPKENKSEKPTEVVQNSFIPDNDKTDIELEDDESTNDINTYYLLDTEKVGSNKDLFNEIQSKSFYNWVSSIRGNSNLDFKDISTVITLDDTQYKNIVSNLSSAIRCGLYDKNNLAPLKIPVNIGRVLKPYLTENNSLWVIPYKGKGLLISRFSNGDDYFDIPILLTECKTFGKYTGNIKRVSTIKAISTKGKEWISLSNLKAENPDVIINNIAGVATVSKEAKTSDLNERSDQFIRDFNGKVINSITDEPAIAERSFNSGGRYSNYKTSNGFTMVNCGDYANIGIHCAVSLEELINILNQYKSLYTDNKMQFLYIGNEASDVADSNIVDNFSFIKDANGKVRQILPSERAGRILSLAAANMPEVSLKLSALLNPLQKGNKKTTRVLSLTINNSYHNIAVIGDSIIEGEYNNTTGEFIPNITGIHIPNTPSGIQQLFNNIVNDKGVFSMRLIEFNHNLSTNKIFTGYTTTNWLLSTLLCDISNDNLVKLDNILKNDKFKHGIFLDDRGIKDDNAPGYYRVLDKGEREYYTDTTKFEYSRYAIDTAKIEYSSEGKSETSEKRKQLIEICNDYGLDPNKSLDEINKELKNRMQTKFNIAYSMIIENENEYGFVFRNSVDPEVFKEWLEKFYGIKADGEDLQGYMDAFDRFRKEDIGLYKNILWFGDILEDYAFNGSQEFLNYLKSQLIDSNHYYRIYIVQRMSKQPIAFDNISKVIQDLEYSKKIAIFEDRYTTEYGC